MFILCWLFVWIFAGQDPISFYPAVNDWATALLICGAISIAFEK